MVENSCDDSSHLECFETNSTVDQILTLTCFTLTQNKKHDERKSFTNLSSKRRFMKMKIGRDEKTLICFLVLTVTTLF